VSETFLEVYSGMLIKFNCQTWAFLWL